MTTDTVALTDVGRDRPHNEDAVYAGTVDDWTLLVVADGMGGHSAGDVASETAIETFVDTLEDGAIEDSETALVAGVRAANERLHEMAAEDPELDGMGTTLVAALVAEGTATIVNVGDSRAYHTADGDIEQVTTDQSLVQKLVEQGTIDPEDADDHPQKNVLSQALGTDEEVEPDTYQVALDGTLLLCSDGLSDEVPDEKIGQVVAEADSLSTAAQRLIGTANEIDGGDNISVVLGRGHSGESGTESGVVVDHDKLGASGGSALPLSRRQMLGTGVLAGSGIAVLVWQLLRDSLSGGGGGNNTTNGTNPSDETEPTGQGEQTGDNATSPNKSESNQTDSSSNDSTRSPNETNSTNESR
jgi:protein phosphatase